MERRRRPRVRTIATCVACALVVGLLCPASTMASGGGSPASSGGGSAATAGGSAATAGRAPAAAGAWRADLLDSAAEVTASDEPTSAAEVTTADEPTSAAEVTAADEPTSTAEPPTPAPSPTPNPLKIRPDDPTAPAPATPAPSWRRLTVAGAYGGLYGGAAKIGSRLGLEDEFRVMRLESAWLIDVFGHVYATKHTGLLFTQLHLWTGADDRTARVHGAWSAAFGSLLYMEIINGFMPGVRFDWVDPVANAAGAALVSEGPTWRERHPWLRRFTLELGYDDWSLLTEPDDQTGPFTRIWHDYPNQRWGLGYAIGPVERPWLRVFGTYGVTSLDIDELRQEWGVGVELKPHHWLAPWIERIPGGERVLDAFAFVDRNLLLPGLYLHLATFESGPLRHSEPFAA